MMEKDGASSASELLQESQCVFELQKNSEVPEKMYLHIRFF